MWELWLVILVKEFDDFFNHLIKELTEASRADFVLNLLVALQNHWTLVHIEVVVWPDLALSGVGKLDLRVDGLEKGDADRLALQLFVALVYEVEGVLGKHARVQVAHHYIFAITALDEANYTCCEVHDVSED